MMDQQNFEAARPASADPSVALAQALGQLPKESSKAPPAKPALAASVETLARQMGLKLGDQNQLTIRRIKRGKNYSFVRANGTPIRHAKQKVYATLEPKMKLGAILATNTSSIPLQD